ncbi:MAG TPA: protein translocase subunit SecD [Candidatus Choladousia intestinavium]|uniref:Multifunctional fusion protein n=1 Tax=Candidatus Choladousia intestinavium TaxID=2840727 RepID=A0A9D1DA64_9FIRM|nr:protein translocase subunit SecD [Candidatus Choladousia intestinavium]
MRIHKKNAGILLAVLAALLLLLVYTAAFGFGKTGTGSAKNIKLGLDLSGGVSITFQARGEEAPSQEDMSDTIYKLQQRVDAYDSEGQVYQEGDDRINIEIPGETDANAILEELGKPGSLEFRLSDGTVVLDGSQVEDASVRTQDDQIGNSQYVVELILTDSGAEAFAQATGENIGETIEIVYDGEVISAPVVEDEITGGQAYITGMADIEEAQNLASSIRIGALSLELQEIRSNVVGAQLGEDAIQSSLLAGTIGLVLVIILMIVVYALPGVVSGFALIFYVALILVTLNAFDLTLTLPGIAGIILSIGMAVDANVIIYARIREEIAAGRSVRGSIKEGFHKALSAILDGNITTLIAAFVLNLMGSGSVKGFAQTLALGIVLSMFTALVISRLLVTALYELGFKDEKYYGKEKKRKNIDFVGMRRVTISVAVIAILAGPVCMGIQTAAGNGPLNLSMDFVGGTSTSVIFPENLTIQQIDEDVKPIFENITGDAEIQSQKVADSNEVILKTRVLSVDEREQVAADLQEAYGMEEKDIAFETISSTVSSEMRRDAVIAVVIAAVCMLIYIWIRFHDIRFATSAVLALLHDVLVVFACYALVRISVGNTFIACMLTILGYSINATIVIFDRIRENLVLLKGRALAEIVNTSITETLTRSIYTSLTTFITIAVLFLLGVSTIREFALPLMVGILAGAYSSVCLTGVIWYLMRGGERKAAS